MGNKCKRFLVLLMAVLMMASLAVVGFAEETEPEKNAVCYEHGDVNGDGIVNDRDAIYVLYSTFWGDKYPITQDIDLNEDSKVDSKDAIRLLYATFGRFELDGTIHTYYDPVWTWTETADGWNASVAFSCGCGEEHDPVEAQVSHENQAATCVAAGYDKYTATAVYEDQTYTDEKTIVLAAGTTGHDIGDPTCTEGAECANCDYSLPELGHSYELKSTTAATCTAQAVEHWECTSCGDEKDVTLEGTLNHTYAYVENGDVLYSTLNLSLEGAEHTDCLWVKQYVCACGEYKAVTLEDTYHKHTFTVTLTTEATCVTSGVKTFDCDNCDYSYTEDVVNADAHNWNDGVTAEGITTYTCTHNSAHTKTAVAMTNNGLYTAALAGNEVELAQGTTVTLDEATVNALEADKTVVITVEPETNLSLTEEQKEQIGNNTVYDFNMRYSDGTAVTDFVGSVTVSLPYTLQDGDDIDSIDVWFISDSGELTSMKGTYANGYVTFTTNHFSYYTVTRLTPVERCARYGHLQVDSNKEATCTADGYSSSICHRCGAQIKMEVIPATGHSYDRTVITEATCTEAGSYTDTCSVCNHTVNGTTPALGHDMQKDEENSCDATCSAPGKEIHHCHRGNCGHRTERELPQLGHEFEETNTPADCTHNGSTVKTCPHCSHSEVVTSTPALGHGFHEDTAVWNWSEDYTSATVTLTCSHDGSHVETLNAVIVKNTEAASCSGSGTTTYTAKVSHNRVTYTDVKTVTLESVPHQAGETWLTNETQHYHECTVCEAVMDAADHTWNDGTVIKAATCTESGQTKYACLICGYEKTVTVSATGTHDYKNGVCTGCGKEETDCNHIRMYTSEVDLSAYDICGEPELIKSVCECGEYGWVNFTSSCEWECDFETRFTADGREYTVWINHCTDCGLIMEDYTLLQMVDGACAGEYLWNYALILDGTTILHTKYRFESEPISHPCVFEKETVSLEDYGVCDGTSLITWTCSCGEEEMTQLWIENCEFDFNWDSATRTGVCENCGLTWTYSCSEGTIPDSCYYLYTENHTLTMDGQQIAAFTNEDKYAYHDYVVDDYILYGNSCEDGIYLYLSCADCGKELEEYAEWHRTFKTATIDLSGENICYDSLEQRSCLCSQKQQIFHMDGENYCDWGETSYDEATNTCIYTCQTCGATQTRVETHSEKGADCYAQIQEICTFKDADGKTLATAYRAYGSHAHEWEVSYALVDSESNCLSGVQITESCADCGMVGGTWTEYSHIGVETNRYAIEGACHNTEIVTYTCICGERAWHATESTGGSACDWNWIKEEELENGYASTYLCYDCGTYKTESYQKLYTVNSCAYMRRCTVTLTRDDETIKSFVYDYIVSTHKSIYKLTLLDGATTCEGNRVQVDQTCLTCGFTSSQIRRGHVSYTLSREVVSEGRFCSDLELVTQGCACGYNSYQYVDYTTGWCDRTWYYDEETGEEVHICSDCGLEERYSRTSAVVEGETCLLRQVRTYRYVCEDELITTAVEQHTEENHDWNTTFTLNGSTCADGYSAVTTCGKCGDSYSFSGDECEEWHTVCRKTYHDGTDICGPVIWDEYGCACGEERHGYLDSYCRWDHMGYDEDGNDIEKCMSCGLTRIGYYRRENVADSCKSNVTYYYVYSLNDEELFTVDHTVTVTEHTMVATFTMNGESCEDGYTVTMTCVNCDYSEYHGSYYKHNHFPTAYYDLTDYGMCEGTIELNRCACGKYYDSYWWFSCDFTYSGEDTETGLSLYTCRECGVKGYYGAPTERNAETCREEGTFYAHFTRDDAVILDIQTPVSWESHNQLATEMTLYDADAGCEGGWSVDITCQDCGETYTERGYGHNTFRTKYLDLEAAGACGGYIRQRECPCGKYADVYSPYDCNMTYEYWTEVDDSYITHQCSKGICQECGLTLQFEWWTEFEGDSCDGRFNEIYQYSLNGTDLATFQGRNDASRHEWERTSVELVNGATSCEDGVWVYETCRKCGETNYYDTYGGHVYYSDESIDLSAYGSVCGATLNHYTCGCGQYQRYDFSDDTLCELDKKSVSHWIEGVIDTAQYTSQGYVWTDSYSYTYICSVTDPQQCGLKIRMSRYWLKNGCEVTQYQTLQLGYDDQTGTCEKEITIATGSKHAYHDYESTSISDTAEDGGKITGTLYTCPDCGSTLTYKYYYDAEDGTQIKYQRIAENALYATNGENQRYYYTYEYGLEHEGYHYRTLELTEKTYNNGEVYWYKYVYEYDFTDKCYCMCTFTNSNGGFRQYEENAHQTSSQRVILTKRTCTQYYTYKYVYTCQVCDHTYDSSTYSYDPYAHDWNYDSTKETYVCGYCGLENSNGASGSIVLEDLTEEYGNDTDYVIGYWNRNNVQVIRAASVILDDVGEDQDNQIVLTGITFAEYDGNIVAFSCNIAEVQAAAEAALAEANYTGSYAIRISCVPVNAEDTLDYAITFDSQTAE